MKEKIRKTEIIYSELPFCEGCGENHTDFGASIMHEDGGTSWCIDCWVDDEDCDFTKEEWEKIRNKEKESELKYYREKVRKLEDELGITML